VYVLHFEPAYRHARHDVGWARDVDARVAEHLAGAASPLVRAAVLAGASVAVALTYAGSRQLERRLKRWRSTWKFCPICRGQRAGALKTRRRGADMTRPPISQAAAERLADDMVWKQLATDRVYLHAENAGEQAAREGEVALEVWRHIEHCYDVQ
jgi:predicted GIY-YIG superfamily endonuclease